MPDRFCDDRVKVLLADARTLSPTILQEYAPEVRNACNRGVRRTSCALLLPLLSFATVAISSGLT